jgi:hypothetical protein
MKKSLNFIPFYVLLAMVVLLGTSCSKSVYLITEERLEYYEIRDKLAKANPNDTSELKKKLTLADKAATSLENSFLIAFKNYFGTTPTQEKNQTGGGIKKFSHNNIILNSPDDVTCTNGRIAADCKECKDKYMSDCIWDLTNIPRCPQEPVLCIIAKDGGPKLPGTACIPGNCTGMLNEIKKGQNGILVLAHYLPQPPQLGTPPINPNPPCAACESPTSIWHFIDPAGTKSELSLFPKTSSKKMYQAGNMSF